MNCERCKHYETCKVHNEIGKCSWCNNSKYLTKSDFLDRNKYQEALDFLDEECEIIKNQPYKQDAEDLFEMKKESILLLQTLINEHFKTQSKN